MWILGWLPYWVFYAILFAGLAGLLVSFVLSFIPFVSQYKTPIQVLAVVLIAIGTYMSGAISNEEAWQAKVNEMQVRVAEAEAKAQQKNVEIVEKVVYKTQLIREKGDTIIKYVDREIVKYDEKCTIPSEFVDVLNQAASPDEKGKK